MDKKIETLLKQLATVNYPYIDNIITRFNNWKMMDGRYFINGNDIKFKVLEDILNEVETYFIVNEISYPIIKRQITIIKKAY